MDLGEKLTDVIPIRSEQNSWFYLRAGLEEERRCCGELQNDLPPFTTSLRKTAELLKRIESDGSKHRTEIRDMLARTDPQSFGSS
jgi:hypothetical protein